MKNTFFTKMSRFALAAILLLAVASTGCKKKGEQPELPPEGSMALDFSDFKDGNRIAPHMINGDLPDYGIAEAMKTLDSTATWGHAALNVLVWDVILFVNLAVPVASFSESFNHNPQWDRREEKWQWSYDFNWGARYTANLFGWFEGNDIRWEMHISKQNGFQDVVWFTGTSQLDRQAGSWALNRDGDNPEPYIGIAWTRGASDSEIEIKYTNVIPGHVDNGDYLEYGILDGDPDYDRFYNIYRIAQDNLIEIKWHHLNQDGRVKNFAHFGDNDWHCWDDFHVDKICN